MKTSERHRLKENELATTVARARDIFGDHVKQIGLVALAVVLVMVAIMGYTIYLGRTSAKAGALYAEAAAIDEATIAPPGEMTLPNQPKPTRTYPSERARAEAALPKYLEVAKAYPSSTAGISALYRSAALLAELGRTKDAQARYQEVIDRDSKAVYKPMAQLAIATLHLRESKYTEAITVLRELSQNRDGNLPVDGVLMQLGEAHRKAGQPVEAERAFTRVVDEFPESVYVADARRQIDELKSGTTRS